MPLIYEPKGRALEYAPLALNLYSGCTHRCVYCYAPLALKRDRKTYHQSVRPRANIISTLASEAKRLSQAGEARNILMCFTCDPYQPIESTSYITREALAILVGNGLRASILTKAGTLAQRDLDILSSGKNNEFAVTLTSDDQSESLEWEPGAGTPDERIKNIRAAKKAGLKTWVSFEPVFNPDAVFRLIDATAEYVDLFKVGRLNYHPRAKEIDWRRFTLDVSEYLERKGNNYLLKDDLKKLVSPMAA